MRRARAGRLRAAPTASPPPSLQHDLDLPQICSTNPLEGLYKEIKRGTDGGGVFPNPAALLLAGVVLVEAHDEWQVLNRLYLSEDSMALLSHAPQSAEEVAQSALMAS